MAIIDRFLPQRTNWRFTGSWSAGICVNPKKIVLSICGGSGNFYVGDSSNNEYRLPYLLTEVSVGLSLSFLVSVFGSTKSFPSTGLGAIYTSPRVRGPLSLKELKGNLVMITLSKGTVGASGDLCFVFMGIPWWTMLSPPLQLSCARALGVITGVTGRFEISVASAALARGRTL